MVSNFLTSLRRALRERIAGVTGRTRAHGRMANNIAHGIDSAGIDARIATLLTDARQFVRALAVADALVATVWR